MILPLAAWRVNIDPAVGIVQAYLRLNGFFTVTEFPIVARSRRGTFSLTDMDVLAVRFPHAQHWIPGQGVPGNELARDSALDISTDSLQLIIGEVKEGKALLNRSSMRHSVLETVVRRFGCCEDHPRSIAQQLLETGHASTAVGATPCEVRLVIFGGVQDAEHPSRYPCISLRHVMEYMHAYMRRYSDVFQPAELKDDGLSLMALIAKLGVQLS